MIIMDCCVNSFCTGKTCIVTGSSSGIGIACVQALLENGIKNVVMSSRAEPKKIEKELKHFKENFQNSSVMYIQCDVRNAEDMKNLFDTTKDKFGGLDILINNAGVFSETNWIQTIDTNLKGSIMGTEFAYKYMSKENCGHGGTIVNVVSDLGFMPMASAPVYVATKHGMIGFTRSMAMPYHFKKSGIRIMALCPGLTDTSLIQQGMEIVNNKPTPMMMEWLKEISVCESQESKYPANCLIKMLAEGQNGSIWMSKSKEIYEVKYPVFESFKKISP